MPESLWIVEVLQDIVKFADNNGLDRLRKATEQATEEFLEDVREQHLAGIADLSRKSEDRSQDRVVVHFPRNVNRTGTTGGSIK